MSPTVKWVQMISPTRLTEHKIFLNGDLLVTQTRPTTRWGRAACEKAAPQSRSWVTAGLISHRNSLFLELPGPQEPESPAQHKHETSLWTHVLSLCLDPLTSPDRGWGKVTPGSMCQELEGPGLRCGAGHREPRSAVRQTSEPGPQPLNLVSMWPSFCLRAFTCKDGWI